MGDSLTEKPTPLRIPWCMLNASSENNFIQNVFVNEYIVSNDLYQPSVYMEFCTNAITNHIEFLKGFYFIFYIISKRLQKTQNYNNRRKKNIIKIVLGFVYNISSLQAYSYELSYFCPRGKSKLRLQF